MSVSPLVRRLLQLALACAAFFAAASARAQPEPPPEPPAPTSDAPVSPLEAPLGESDDAPIRPKTAHAPLKSYVPPTPPPLVDTSNVDADVGSGGPSEKLGEAVRYTLEAIEVKGNNRTRSRVVLRFLPFGPGDVFDVDDPRIIRTRYRLLGTGFFRDVQFSLRKGSRRGYVVLVIEVVERNTIIINDLWMGLSADADTKGNAQPLTAYAGLDVAETNLAGTGITLGGAMGLARDQLALRVRFLDPALLGTNWMTSGELLFNDAIDFFGNADVLYQAPNRTDEVTDHAVLEYKRFGGALGVGRDLSVPTQLWMHYRLESIDALPPLASSHRRGQRREPIEYDIVRGSSVLSTLRATLQHDTRDQPFLPTQGWRALITAEVSLTPLGSDYPYQRFDVSAQRWWSLHNGHVLSLSLFGGAITGDAPFFEQYYVGDFTDFLPARVLGLNVDRRPAPNFLGTDIIEIRYGEYAGKVGAEYRIPLYRGSRSVYGIDFFASTGVYAVAGARDITNPPEGYSGAALIPIDITGNLGFRMDTSAGGFAFAFSNVLGFVPVRSEVNR